MQKDDAVGQLFGQDASVDADSHHGLDGLFLWINAGRLPLLMLIILALGVFSIGGFLLQGIAHSVGTAVPVSIAALVAAAGSIPVIRSTSRGLSRIIPRDETYAVSDADFIGKRVIRRRTVNTDSKHHRIRSFEFGHISLIRLKFLCSTLCESENVKR